MRPVDFYSMEVREAKQFVERNLAEGKDCPCCGQFAKRYRRKISTQMAKDLLILNRWCAAHPGKFTHMPRLLQKNGGGASNMAALLRHWGLIEQQPGERDDGSWRTGFYRVTPKGRLFSEGKITVDKYVFIYNQRVVDAGDSLSGDMPQIHIDDAIGSFFLYAELMASTEVIC